MSGRHVELRSSAANGGGGIVGNTAELQRMWKGRKQGAQEEKVGQSKLQKCCELAHLFNCREQHLAVRGLKH